MSATIDMPLNEARRSILASRAPQGAPGRLQPCAWQAFDAVRRPIALCDATGRLVYANHALATLATRLKLAPESSRPATLDEIFGGDQRAEAMVAAIARGEALSTDIALSLAGRPRVHLRVSIDPLEAGLSGGDVAGPRALVAIDDLSPEMNALAEAAERELARKAMIASLEDTDAKQGGQTVDVAGLVDSLAFARDEAERAKAAKVEFLTMISQKVRTPLNGVLGSLWLLLEGALDPRQRDSVQAAKDSAEALLTVINDVLDFSKMEAGQLALERITYDLGGVVGGIIHQLEAKALESGLPLRAQIEPDVPVNQIGDPVRLRQVLLNLLGNALNFTEKGQVILRVSRVEAGPDSGAMLRFEVRDTGVGISAERQPRLFDKFAPLDSSLVRPKGDAGLGLPICQRLVTMMGGKIGVESRSGKGSTFWFTLPCKPALGSQAPALAADLTRTRIVVVGAGGERRQNLIEALKAAGAGVAVADTPNTALERLREGAEHHGQASTALYVADALSNEAASFAELVRADRRLQDVSLIALVTSGLRGDAARSKEFGFAAYLTEPLDPELLLRCLREIESSKEAGGTAAAPLITIHSLREAIGRVPVVLVAEDHPVNQRLAAALVERLGCEVIIVGDGAQAVERVRAGGIDAVLMDVHMPGMDGTSATRAIRQLGGDLGRVPIIAVTANVMAGDEDKYRAAGMDDYVPKPIEPERLKASLLRWLRRRPQSDAPAPGTSPVADPGAPVLDRVVLEQLESAIGRPGTIDLVKLYLDTTVERLEAFERAIARGDLEMVRSEAHDLKSTSGNLGASRLWAQARAVEAAAKDEAIDVVRDLAMPIRAQFDAVREAFGARYPA